MENKTDRITINMTFELLGDISAADAALDLGLIIAAWTAENGARVAGVIDISLEPEDLDLEDLDLEGI